MNPFKHMSLLHVHIRKPLQFLQILYRNSYSSQIKQRGVSLAYIYGTFVSD